MTKEEEAHAIIEDLKQWLYLDDGEHLCSHYKLPIKSILVKDLDHPDIYIRYNSEVSYLEADMRGKVKWFVINPELPEQERLTEAKAMIAWLYQENLSETYSGRVGDTEFSRWLWQEELEGDWSDLLGGKAALVKVSRERGGIWAGEI